MMIGTAAAGPSILNLHTRTSYEHPIRNNVIQAPTQRICNLLMQGPLEKDFQQDLTRYKVSQSGASHKLLTQGPLKEDLAGSSQYLVTGL